MPSLDRVSRWGQIRVALDSQIVDLIADTPGVLEAIQRAANVGRLIVVTSHIIRDELGATSDSARRHVLLGAYDALPREDVATHGFVLGVSRLGEARLGDGKESGISLGDVRTRGKGGLHDALIATTASGQAKVLVTEDKDLRRKVQASSAQCEVWSFADLVAFVSTQGEGHA